MLERYRTVINKYVVHFHMQHAGLFSKYFLDGHMEHKGRLKDWLKYLHTSHPPYAPTQGSFATLYQWYSTTTKYQRTNRWQEQTGAAMGGCVNLCRFGTNLLLPSLGRNRLKSDGLLSKINPFSLPSSLHPGLSSKFVRNLRILPPQHIREYYAKGFAERGGLPKPGDDDDCSVGRSKMGDNEEEGTANALFQSEGEKENCHLSFAFWLSTTGYSNITKLSF